MGLEDLFGVQIPLWRNGRWEKEDRSILQGYTEEEQAL